MKDPIQFKPREDDGAPKLLRARGGVGPKAAYCGHRAQMTINEDTQLVTCTACGLVMSAYSALLIISRQWEHMHYDVTEWKKMNAERELAQKASNVKRKVRELQWVELPDEGDEPARTYWLRIKELSGEDPYAMFRRGRENSRGGIQYCVLNNDHSGWSDADFLIKTLEQKREAGGNAKVATPEDQA